MQRTLDKHFEEKLIIPRLEEKVHREARDLLRKKDLVGTCIVHIRTLLALVNLLQQ